MLFRYLLFILALASETTLAKAEPASNELFYPTFYSSAARELEVSYRSVYRTKLSSLQELSALSITQREQIQKNEVAPLLRYLFGPLTNRGIGSPQKGASIEVLWDQGSLVGGRVHLPYVYKGIWLVGMNYSYLNLQIPIPLDEQSLFTRGWKNCTDSAPDHQTPSFFWYFWDPKRFNCDHREGVQYSLAKIRLGRETLNQKKTFPEYDELLKSAGIDKNFQLTFAFGYVEDQENPNPEKDLDPGMVQYRLFNQEVRKIFDSGIPYEEQQILSSEYPNQYGRAHPIGRRFRILHNGVNVTISVVTSAGVDQMELFAKSFAHDHDGFFGWFGHSRVGDGFDANQFSNYLRYDPEYYSISQQYQIIYWAGCNSYSYYTLPFFDFKIQSSNGIDPNGTKGLDIISNGLPSYFSANQSNASTVLKYLLDWQNRPSYQTMVQELEKNAEALGINTLTVVLGDEDNNQ